MYVFFLVGWKEGKRDGREGGRGERFVMFAQLVS